MSYCEISLNTTLATDNEYKELNLAEAKFTKNKGKNVNSPNCE